MLLKSFYARISLLFLAMILLLGATSLYIAFEASRLLFGEVEQKLNRGYAANIALELEPFTAEDFTEEDIKEAIHYMMVMNPSVEIYLLNHEGNILCYFSEIEEEITYLNVDLEPVRSFVESEGFNRILGDDPRNDKVKKPFSAAPLTINGKEGWVYVILRGSSYDSSLEMLRNSYYMRSGLITFIVALAATAVVGLSLFFVLTRRLRRLSEAVTAFRHGRLQHRVSMRGDDEISALGYAFNDMAESIAEGIRQLREAERLRGELIANISHDLRSPLTSIRGSLETLLLKESSLSGDERRDLIEVGLRNVAGFQKLVEGLFELAKLEARQVSLQKITFSVAELIQDVVLKLQPRFNAKQLDVSYNPAADIPSLTADIGLIERMLTNIIENAVNNTPGGGSVSINLETSANGLVISVADTGPGISKEDLPRIFERFYRSDKSRSRDSEGTGLGLAIAREVAELHGGSIAAESPGNGGAVFIISLPL
ncbi:HAMP domain-containing sensor histidine kinase [Marispirochaeta aestuarii]|uniref:sensor histidine kinase n=1 Tax=Marispirochaeta aestuarii TaxID=1963862 RepID=UPI0029C7C5AF|nr:HAMP domain-containing sensor histidine kinase [Marispirochaeta aestuarii]